MNCLHPIVVPNSENPVACGNCLPCLARARRDWALRLHFERKASQNAYFLTLTYSDENLVYGEDGVPSLCKGDISEFLKCIRNASRERISVVDASGNLVRKRVNRTPRWFVVGEYGPKTQRPHYHAIVFNIKPEVLRSLSSYWKKGFIQVKPISEKRINYACKYQITLHSFGAEEARKKVRPFRIVTKSTGGLGKQWLTEANKQYARLQLNGLIRSTSGFVPLPKYYRDRIGFTPAEKQQLLENIEFAVCEKYRKTIDDLRKSGYDNPECELAIREEQVVKNMFRKFTKTCIL